MMYREKSSPWSTYLVQIHVPCKILSILHIILLLHMVDFFLLSPTEALGNLVHISGDSRHNIHVIMHIWLYQKCATDKTFNTKHINLKTFQVIEDYKNTKELNCFQSKMHLVSQ